MATLAAQPKTKAQKLKEQADKEAAERKKKEEEARVLKEARLEVLYYFYAILSRYLYCGCCF